MVEKGVSPSMSVASGFGGLETESWGFYPRISFPMKWEARLLTENEWRKRSWRLEGTAQGLTRSRGKWGREVEFLGGVRSPAEPGAHSCVVAVVCWQAHFLWQSSGAQTPGCTVSGGVAGVPWCWGSTRGIQQKTGAGGKGNLRERLTEMLRSGI